MRIKHRTGTPPIRDTKFPQLPETSNCSNSSRPREKQCTIEQVDSFMKLSETAYLEGSKKYPLSFEDFKLFLKDCYGDKIEGIPSEKLGKMHNLFLILPMFKFCKEEMEWNVDIVVLALLRLAKYSNLFRRKYDPNEIKKILEDDEALIAGAILLRICLVLNTKGVYPQLIDPRIEPEEAGSEEDSVNSYTRIFELLITWTCILNVHLQITDSNKSVCTTICPVSAGSPIFCSAASIYDFMPELKRQAEIKKMYKITCHCKACQENWLETIRDNERFEASLRVNPLADNDLVDVIRKFNTRKDLETFPLEELMFAKAVDIVKQLWEQFPMPSKITCDAIQTLTSMLQRIHVPLNGDLERDTSCHI
ncbi:hypothetical protein QAD02_001045 [Eretmocerus hayati]|uniref:Uncharacterized protein n=1 Tax=Eretmocerus hayati TaxID=131215 RepID=A0ACC2NFC6_9HYME|nr:hypothetical protein QAD02_001045 [Eretmocerus hayati]